MGWYLLRRLAQAVAVLAAAYTVTFVILYLLPGDPVAAAASAGVEAGTITPEDLAALRAANGLDQPLVVQYLQHLGSALRGDLGTSITLGRPVTTLVSEALPPTAQLAGTALALAVLAGGGLAVLATYTRTRWLRQLLLSLPPLGVSVPVFWVGLVLVQVFSFTLPWFPAFGDDAPGAIVLPAITMAIPTGAMVAQVLAKSLLTAGEEPYVDTATAKGASRWRVHLRHVLRNASLPALTVVGLLLGNLLASAVVVETVFGRNGMGRLTASAVSTQDTPVVQGVVLFGALVFVTTNLLVDLVYPLLDPRIAVVSRKKLSPA